MVNWFSRMVDRIFAVIFAIILMQLPMFMEQYTMRLSGHLNELSFQVNQLDKIAKSSGKSLEQFIEKFTSSQDTDFAKQGLFLKEMVIRESRLTDKLYAMIHANVITRPFVFLFRSDWTIARATASSYQFGLSLSLESAVYGIVGVMVGYLIYQGVAAFFSRFSEGLRRARRKEKGEK